jgi:hypothetical protein
MIQDEVLQEKLRAFTRRVASALSYEECRRFLAERRRAVVEHEPQDAERPSFTYLWEVLALEEVPAGRCARVFTHACDGRRWGLGSAYTPLCSGAWIFEDGHIEFFPLGNAVTRTPAADF